MIKNNAINNSSPCPCQTSSSKSGSNNLANNKVKTYAFCCGKYHKGKLHPSTAEELMRSRYTAYVIGNAQYLYRTWHEKTRPTLQSLRNSGGQQLISLNILSTQAGGVDDAKGMVEFVTTYDTPADQKPTTDTPEQPLQHKEKSLFVRVKKKWVYIDAI